MVGGIMVYMAIGLGSGVSGAGWQREIEWKIQCSSCVDCGGCVEHNSQKVLLMDEALDWDRKCI